MKDIKLIIFIIFLSGTICSCLTDSKLKKHADMYYSAHPDIYARKCANSFPATVTPGDTIRSSDTTYLPGAVLPCPERVDTNGKKVRDSVKCPPPKIIHDKIFVHDTLIDVAAVTAMAYDTARVGAENRALKTKLIQTTTEKDEAKKQAKNRLLELIGLSVISLFLLFLVIKFIIL